MTDGTALLAAILASPEEDTPRLMYADWLDETYGPTLRSEFIRVQIQLAVFERRFGPVSIPMVAESGFWVRPSGAEENSLLDRQKQLLGLSESFYAPGDKLVVLPREHWSRGFLEHPRINWADWLYMQENMIRLHPIREVTLTSHAYRSLSRGEYSQEAVNRGMAYSAKALSQKWKKIKFNIHSTSSADFVPVYDDQWREPK